MSEWIQLTVMTCRRFHLHHVFCLTFENLIFNLALATPLSSFN